MKEILIYGVKKGSIAEDLGIAKGDKLLSINGEEVLDILDYKFAEADCYVELEIKHVDGEVEIYEIEKEESEALGLVFETELIDKPRNCHNKCIFCFMEQLPKNVRNSLIFKDDDYRLSFFSGNYITLTNMKQSDIRRIIKYRMSPINISVHATDNDVRCMMLNNRFAGKVLKYMDLLYEADINMNAQIVLCKGINDGKILEKTIQDLSKYIPVLKSICIVPVGLSKNREGLYPLVPLEKQDCIDTIKLVERYQTEFKKKHKTMFVFPADEIYIKAGIKIPSYKEYGEFEQIEDGIGLMANFEHEFEVALKNIESNLIHKRITIITGKITEEYIRQKVQILKNEKLPNIDINVVAPINNFFGEQITVTGLITGQDILRTINELKQNSVDIGEYVMFPKIMLKEDEDIFLDDMLLEELQEKINTKIVVTDGTGSGFINGILLKKIEKNIIKLYNLENFYGNSYENSII